MNNEAQATPISSNSQPAPIYNYLINSSQPDLKEQGLNFLIEDFKDTSEHLRVTQHKIELPFQIYAGAGTIIITLIISVLSSSSSNSIIKDIMNDLNLAIFLTIFSIISYLLFIYSIKAAILHGIYLNRLNFLRDFIYQFSGLFTKEKPLDGLFFTQKNIPDPRNRLKVGLNDLISISIGISNVILLLFAAIFWGNYLIGNYFLISPYNMIYIVACVLLIGLFIWHLLVMFYSVGKQIRQKINKLWPD